MSSKAIKTFSPAFLRAIDASARRIFGHLPPASEAGMSTKMLKNKPIGPLIINHYIDTKYVGESVAGLDDDFQTELQERRDIQLERLRKKGKGPPKKGQGRRTTKK